MEEVWKDIAGYEGRYKISNIGNAINALGKYTPQETKPNGYKSVCLYKNKISTKYYVHRLVANAFIQNKNNYKVVHHIDHNKSNNCVDNLEWCTHSMNLKYAYDNGKRQNTCYFGENAKNAKLKRSDVSEIKKMLASGIKGTDIAKKFNVSKHMISRIKTNKNWSDVI